MNFTSPTSNIPLNQIYSITSPALFPWLFTKILNYGMREKTIFVYRSFERIILYQRRQKIASLDTIAFLETHQQSTEIITFF